MRTRLSLDEKLIEGWILDRADNISAVKMYATHPESINWRYLGPKKEPALRFWKWSILINASQIKKLTSYSLYTIWDPSQFTSDKSPGEIKHSKPKSMEKQCNSTLKMGWKLVSSRNQCTSSSCERSNNRSQLELIIAPKTQSVSEEKDEIPFPLS